MSRNVYTIKVLVCALSWLLVGLHAGTLHDLTHGGTPRWLPLGLLALFLVLAIADTWSLLRGPVLREGRPASHSIAA